MTARSAASSRSKSRRTLSVAAPRVSPGEAEEARDHLEVLATGHRGLDRGVLAGEADQPAHALGLGDCVDARDAQRAGVGLGERRDHADEGGLARAVGPEQRDDTPGFGFEVEAVERAHFAVLLDEIVGFDDWCH